MTNVSGVGGGAAEVPGELLVCTGAQRGTGCVPEPALGPDNFPPLHGPAPGHQPWGKGLDQPEKDFLTVPSPCSPGSSWGLCHSPQRVASGCSHSSGCSEPPGALLQCRESSGALILTLMDDNSTSRVLFHRGKKRGVGFLHSEGEK